MVAWGGFPLPTSMLEGGEPEQVFTEIVSGTYFGVLGVEPAHGRFVLPEEDQAEGTNPVVVLSHKLWTLRFGQETDILNRTLTINRTSYDVIGVAPPGFQGVNALFSQDVWVPMMWIRSPRFDTSSRAHQARAPCPQGEPFRDAARSWDRRRWTFGISVA